MFLRQSPRVSSVLGAVVVAGGGAAFAGYSFYNNTPSIIRSAHADSPPSPKKVFPASGFVNLPLHSSEMVNHNVKKLKFRLPDEQTVTGMEPISSLLTRHTPEGAWIPVFRPYTPIIVDEPGYVTFMVKKYPNGKGSGKMHSLVPGETLSFKVLAEFPYKPNQFVHMSLIAGGSGITPIYQLIRTVLRNPADKTKLTLVYANNTEQDVLLKSEFDELERKHPDRFKAVYAVSNPLGDGPFHKGYINKQILEGVMADAKEGDRTKVLVSGPPAMTASVAGSKGGFGWTQGSVGGILKELGYSNDQVFKF